MRRDFQLGLALVAAAAIGFAVALLALNKNDSTSTSAVVTTSGATSGTVVTSTTATTGTAGATTSTTTTTATGTVTAPQTQPPTTATCVQLWNTPANRGAKTSLRTIASQQPVRVHVGETAEVPARCLVTVIANNGDAYIYTEGGGATYPYAPQPSRTTAASLPPAQRAANALEQGDGTLQAR
jgi:hypothetical protein